MITPMPPITVPPIARASRPRHGTILSLSRHRRSYLKLAIKEDEDLGAVEMVLDLFQQVSPYNPGKKLRRSVEDFLEILNLKTVCLAMIRASNIHKKMKIGLVNQFRSICEALISDQEAQEDKRIKEFDTQFEKFQAAYEAKKKLHEKMVALMETPRATIP